VLSVKEEEAAAKNGICCRQRHTLTSLLHRKLGFGVLQYASRFHFRGRPEDGEQGRRTVRRVLVQDFPHCRERQKELLILACPFHVVQVCRCQVSLASTALSNFCLASALFAAANFVVATKFVHDFYASLLLYPPPLSSPVIFYKPLWRLGFQVLSFVFHASSFLSTYVRAIFPSITLSSVTRPHSYFRT
jgi:hypothetical protein